MMREMSLGDFKIYWLPEAKFMLDGGSMFGVVPKVLWTKRYPVDGENYIPLVTNPVLIDTGEKRVLLDTGLGNKMTEKQKKIYRIEEYDLLGESLQALGLEFTDIDYVIYSHLDFDHASGGTRLEAGEVVPTFPNARYVVQEREWDDMRSPGKRTSHTYWTENWQVLATKDLVDVVEGYKEILPGIEVFLSGGHTRGHQVIKVSSQGETMLHFGDLMPMHSHLNPLWVMAYDNYPMDSVQQKEQWLEEAILGNWWLSFYHDPFMGAIRVDEKREIVEQL